MPFKLPTTRHSLPLLLLCLVALAGTSGCSWLQFPGVYRLAIQQGNIVTQEMVDQLEPGMTRRQVSYILGTPLIQDSFHQNRWDYFYSLRDPEGDTSQERLTVYFSNDQLTHITGDFQPTRATTLTQPPPEAPATPDTAAHSPETDPETDGEPVATLSDAGNR